MFKKYKLIIINIISLLLITNFYYIYAQEDNYEMKGILLNTYDEFNLKAGDTFQIKVYEKLVDESQEDEDLQVIFGEELTGASFMVITDPANMATVDENGLVTALGKCYGAVVVTYDTYMTSCSIVIDDYIFVWEGWLEEDGKYYWYENERRAGTEGQGKAIYDPRSDAWYWLDASDNGARVENSEVYIEEDKKWVRLLEDGKMAKGWYLGEEGRQYYDPQHFYRYHGLINIEDEEYYFDFDSGLAYEEGWLELDNKYYWFEDAKKQGRLEKILIEDNDEIYCLNPDDNGARFIDSEVEVDGKYYYFDEEGKIYKGFRKTEDKIYFYNEENGEKIFGNYLIDNSLHKFDKKSGELKLGWYKENDKEYWYEKGIRQGTYDDPKGVLGDKKIRGREIYDASLDSWFWLDAEYDGAKAVNKEVWMPYIYADEELGSTEGKWVRYDEDGHMIKGWYENKKEKYYYDETTGAMLKGDYKIKKDYYYFDELSGILDYEGFRNIDDKDYWYEKGIRQGTYNDSKCVLGDGTCRGREIYDPGTKAWYWLDANAEGAKAQGKEVWIPYIYQDEDEWKNNKLKLNQYIKFSDTNALMSNQVKKAILNKEGKWVRYDANGKMAKGWYKVEDEEIEYYHEQEGNIYFYDYVTGLMAKSKTIIDNMKYDFDEISGVLKD